MVNLKRKALLGFFKQVLKRQIVTCHIFVVSWQRAHSLSSTSLQSLLFKVLFHFYKFHQSYVTGEKIHIPLLNYSMFPVPNSSLFASPSEGTRGQGGYCVLLGHSLLFFKNAHCSIGSC
jgi:hypothetical protein